MIDRIKAWWQDLEEQNKEEEEEKQKMKKIFHEEKEPTKRQLRKRINSLEMEVETLQSIIKEDLYAAFMKKLNEAEADKRYKEDNIRLRKQVKLLKQMLREGGDK